MDIEHHKVIIVGAGVAGCTAAYTLIQEGVDGVIVLEATDRVGGRVKSFISEHGFYVECGAQWIHGDEDNPLYEKLDSLKLIEYRGESFESDADPTTMLYYRPDQTLLDQASVVKARQFYDLVSQRIFQAWDPCICSIEEFKSFEGNLICDELKLTDEQRVLMMNLTQHFDVAFASNEAIYPNDRQALINQDIFDPCGGKNFSFVNGTFSIFRDFLLPSIEKNILLNSPVLKITITDLGLVRVETLHKVYTTDHLVFTPSLGYLKKHHKDIFSPPLPLEKRSAIDNLTIGVVEKLSLLFDKPFWIEEVKKNRLFGGYAFVFGKDDEMEGLINKINGILGKKDDWWRMVRVFVTTQTNPHQLLTWLVGEPALQSQQYSDDVVKKVLLSIIAYFTGINIEHGSSFSRTNWGSDEYFLGSYTAITKDHKRLDTETMRKPVYNDGKPVLLFAGEAYHPRLLSSLAAAYETGKQQAELLKQYIQAEQDRSRKGADNINHLCTPIKRRSQL